MPVGRWELDFWVLTHKLLHQNHYCRARQLEVLPHHYPWEGNKGQIYPIFPTDLIFLWSKDPSDGPRASLYLPLAGVYRDITAPFVTQ
ncbi:hypothetical protein XENTR_v10013084 [Xenopus tropicalis]|nr:hypothetical protein XENTR_v10013084 [Xenopus tropicalis]